MSLSLPSVSNISSKPCTEIYAGIKKCAPVVGEAISYTRVLYWLSLFAQSIIEAVKDLKEPAQATKNIHAQRFAYINKGFLSYMDGVLVFVDLKEIFIPDEKGRLFWDHHWQFMAEKISWAVAHGFDFAGFLQFVGVAKMTPEVISGLSYAGVVFKVIAAVWGIWDKSRSIVHNKSKRKRACELKVVWANRSKEWAERHQDCQKRIEICAERLKNPNLTKTELSSLNGKMEKWQTIQNCNDESRLKKFCAKSSKREQKKICKYNTKQIHSILSIIFNSTLIALVALTILARFTSLGSKHSVKVALIALPVAFTAFELGRLTFQKIIKVKRVPKLNVKDLLSV